MRWRFCVERAERWRLLKHDYTWCSVVTDWLIFGSVQEESVFDSRICCLTSVKLNTVCLNLLRSSSLIEPNLQKQLIVSAPYAAFIVYGLRKIKIIIIIMSLSVFIIISGQRHPTVKLSRCLSKSLTKIRNKCKHTVFNWTEIKLLVSVLVNVNSIKIDLTIWLHGVFIAKNGLHTHLWKW